jgi:lipopolysaccharide transport system permease protein
MHTHQHKTPFFSVITITKNSSAFIDRNLEMMEKQTFINFEHILVDGYSSDSTLRILKSYQKRNRNKQIIIASKESRGIGNAFNEAIRLAKGKYVIFINSDDYLYDFYVLRDIAKFLKTHTDVNWIYGKINAIDSINKTSGVFPEEAIFHIRFPMLVKAFNYIPHQAAIYKRSVFERFGLYDETLPSLMDIEFTYRIASKTKWCFINRIISNYSVRIGSDSSDPKNKQRVEKCMEITYNTTMKLSIFTDTIVVRPYQKFQLIDIRELWRYRQLFFALTARDIKVRYKQTYVGMIWILLQPIISMAIYSVIFGTFVKIPSGSLPYSVFVLLGIVYWGLFQTGVIQCSQCLLDNESLIKKVYFPKEILLLSAIVKAFIDFFISTILLFVVMIYYKISVNQNTILFFGLGAAITIVASLGLGLLTSALNIKYRDMKYILPFFLQILFYLTPIIYPLSIISPLHQLVMALNPMTGVISSLHSVLESGYIVHPYLLLISSLSTLILFIIGLWYFKKTEKFFVDIL